MGSARAPGCHRVRALGGWLPDDLHRLTSRRYACHDGPADNIPVGARRRANAPIRPGRSRRHEPESILQSRDRRRPGQDLRRVRPPVRPLTLRQPSPAQRRPNQHRRDLRSIRTTAGPRRPLRSDAVTTFFTFSRAALRAAAGLAAGLRPLLMPPTGLRPSGAGGRGQAGGIPDDDHDKQAQTQRTIDRKRGAPRRPHGAARRPIARDPRGPCHSAGRSAAATVLFVA
jgi:hypothetical protein